MENAHDFTTAAEATTYAELASLDETVRELHTAADLRAELDALYSKAFARAPKPVEFARLMAEAKRVHDRLNPCGDKLSSFTVDIVARTGMHLKKVQRLVARGLKVSPEVLDLIDADKRLNKGSVLDRLCRTPAEEQMAVFDQLKLDLPTRKPTTDDERAKAVLSQFEKLPKSAKNIVLKALCERIGKGAV